MTSIKMLGLLGLLGGLALGLVTDAPGHERPPKRLLGSLYVLDDKGHPWDIFRDGDQFVAVRVRKDDNRILPPRNFKITADDMMVVDEKYLGYDLRGKNKKVLVRERSGDDTDWELVISEAKSPVYGYFRVKYGELKGWWIGLGAVEPEKKGEPLPRNRQGLRAPLVLVKDKKDAAGFRWTNPKDEESR
jgi:hypothetical protein